VLQQGSEDLRGTKGSKHRPSKKEASEMQGRDLAEARKCLSLGMAKEQELAPLWGVKKQVSESCPPAP